MWPSYVSFTLCYLQGGELWFAYDRDDMEAVTSLITAGADVNGVIDEVRLMCSVHHVVMVGISSVYISSCL